MDCKTLNKNVENSILRFLENKTETYAERDPYAYDPRARYSSATLINEWYEDRQEKLPHQPHEPFVTEYLENYRQLCKYSTIDRKEYFQRRFDNQGLGQELLIDHLGKSFYNNFTTSYDLSYNHLPKGLCGPFPRKYSKGRYLPENDQTLIFGNLTQWGLKKKLIPSIKGEIVCMPKPPEPEYKSEYVAYDIADVRKLNDAPFMGKRKTEFTKLK